MQRRSFLVNSSIALSSIATSQTASAYANPMLLASFRKRNGQSQITYLDQTGKALFQLDSLHRGHSFAVDDSSNIIIAIPPYPGSPCTILNQQGQEVQKINTEKGRHFCGHGVFDSEGKRLYLTENNYIDSIGVIGVYDVNDNFKRIDEYQSYGAGPHHIEFHRNKKQLVIANSGVATHPKTGLKQLNIETMSPSLAIINASDGTLESNSRLDKKYRHCRLRHFTQASDGAIYVALQNRSFIESTALIAKYDSSSELLTPLSSSDELNHILKGYIGDIKLSSDEQTIICSSRYGGRVILFDPQGRVLALLKLRQVSGLHVDHHTKKIFAVAGRGDVYKVDTVTNTLEPIQHQSIDGMWENHVVGISMQ